MQICISGKDWIITVCNAFVMSSLSSSRQRLMRARRLRSNIGFITFRYWYVRETGSPLSSVSIYAWFGAIFIVFIFALFSRKKNCLFIFCLTLFIRFVQIIFFYPTDNAADRNSKKFNKNTIKSNGLRITKKKIRWKLNVTEMIRFRSVLLFSYDFVMTKLLSRYVLGTRLSMSIAIWEVIRQM